MLTACPFSTSVTPGFHFNKHPVGEPCIYVPICFFCTFGWPARPTVGRFSRSWLRGTQGVRVFTTAQVWVPAEFRGARSGFSKLRDLASNYGIAFHPAEPRRTMEIPIFKILFFRYCCCKVSVSHRPSSSQGLYLVAVTLANQSLPFVTAADGSSVCACLCLISCRPLK